MCAESDRILRLEEAAVMAEISLSQLWRECKRLGIVKERVSPRSYGLRESEVRRLMDLRRQVG